MITQIATNVTDFGVFAWTFLHISTRFSGTFPPRRGAMCINEWQLALGYETDIFPWTIVFDEKWNESQQTYQKIKERVTSLREHPKIVSNTQKI